MRQRRRQLVEHRARHVGRRARARRGRRSGPAASASARTSGAPRAAIVSPRSRRAERRSSASVMRSLPMPLRLVERRVGRHQQVAQRLAVLAGTRHADGAPRAASRPGRSAASARCRRRQTVRAFAFVVAGSSSANSSPPSAVGAVVRPHAAASRRADHAQRVVAGHVAAPVVEVLEVVEVGDHQREGDSRRAAASSSAAPSSWKRRWFGRPVSASVSDAATTSS